MIYDEERALYNLTGANLCDCVFAGPADGESALKECRDIRLENCSFSLRYPLWHTQNFEMTDSRMDENTRAPIWYSENGRIVDSDLNGIKAVRECKNITIRDCSICSPEFGWKCDGITMTDSKIQSEYLFLDSRNVTLDHVEMKGKYSFQYMENLTIRNCFLNTKDAFWHSKNVTVTDSVLRGEYLGWFSENLTLIGCKIIGTQPLCYCRNLKLQDCIMEDTDLAFEYSDVEATIVGHVDSIKNPRSGEIIAESVGEIIMEDAVMECTGNVITKQ
ncbi:MAG: DUF3737 family protein [Oscillospiraceae bacterium]|nr:DUF3737 family protein [Oscillospiraceae bacterium]MBQ7130383.1 DUF3737 family protein [Oscillospiraceae bacterium]